MVAYDATFYQLKKKVSHFSNKMEIYCGNRKPMFLALFNIVFGENGTIYQCYKEEGIIVDHTYFLHFIITFFLCQPARCQQNNEIQAGKYLKN